MIILIFFKRKRTTDKIFPFNFFLNPWHPPHDWNQGVPLFRWLKQDLPRILTDSLEPCHFHRLNGFRRPLPYFRHMLWPSPSASWLKHLSCICDLSAVSYLWLHFLWQIYPRSLRQGWSTWFIVKFFSSFKDLHLKTKRII